MGETRDFIHRAVLLLSILVSFCSHSSHSVLLPYNQDSYPKFLPGSSLRDETPWGNMDPGSTRPPNTGAVRRYDFTITRSTGAPDGIARSMTLVNGEYPGPLMEANWGDTIEVNVHNNISSEMKEGTTLHWHGFTQKNTGYYDGVPGVSQCPIAPGQSLTYRFQADQYGSTWYHSHYSMQYTDGVLGPMVVYGPSQLPYDVDLGHILLNDWMNVSYYQQLQKALATPPAFANVDNNLLNGRGVIPCTQTVSTKTQPCDPYSLVPRFNLSTGKTYRLRLVNVGDEGTQKFQVDGYELTVIANDFVPVVPYQTRVVTLGIGQRTDVLFKAVGKPTDAVWMRSDLDIDCLNLTATNPTARAVLYYDQADRKKYPNTTGANWLSNHCRNDPLSRTVPQYPSAPPSNPATTQNVEITLYANNSGILLFAVDGSSFRADYNSPVLLLAGAGNSSYKDSSHREWNVYDFGSNSSVRVVLKNTFEQVHPMHLHGHNFWVLAEGMGAWDGQVVNAQNPQRRDVHLLQPGSVDNPSYVVLEWEQDNPGVWPLHCHTSLHVSAGLYLNVLERPNDIKNRMDIPQKLSDTCKTWQDFTSHNVVDQIDAGV